VDEEYVGYLVRMDIMADIAAWSEIYSKNPPSLSSSSSRVL